MLAASRRDKADAAKHGGDPDVHRAGHRGRGNGSAGQFGVGSILLTRRVTRAACVCAGPGHVRVRRTWTYVTLPTKGASNGHKIHGEG